MVLVAQPFKRKRQHRRRHPRPAGGDRRARKVHPGGLERGAQGGGRLHRAQIGQQIGVGQVPRPRNMPRPQAGPGLRHLAAKPGRGAGVDDFRQMQLAGLRHLRHVLHQPGLPLHRHVPVAHHRGHVFRLAPLGQPFRQPAVQHGHIHLAHQPERPPHPGGRENPRAIIDHHLMPVAHPHRPHPADELFRRRGHMRQGAAVIGDLVDVKEPRAGNMRGGVFRAGIPRHRGQIPACIQHPQIGVFQVRRQPVGGDKRARIIGKVRRYQGGGHGNAPRRDMPGYIAGPIRGKGHHRRRRGARPAQSTSGKTA